MINCSGKCIPITRGGGIYQEHMNEALERLSNGEWVFTLSFFSISNCNIFLMPTLTTIQSHYDWFGSMFHLV